MKLSMDGGSDIEGMTAILSREMVDDADRIANTIVESTDKYDHG